MSGGDGVSRGDAVNGRDAVSRGSAVGRVGTATARAAVEREPLGLRSVSCCLLCGEQGVVEYNRLRDRRGGARGVWGFRRCAACGLAWLDPRPAPECIPRLYENYYTHGQGIPRSGWARWREWFRLALLSASDGYEALAASRWPRRIGRAARRVPAIDEMARLGVMGLEGGKVGGAPRRRLLDVGCGSGRLLAVMRRAGWQVFGVEPDPRAAAAARERYGIMVHAGRLDRARFAARSFDAIVVSHVIEHVEDPVGLLAACRRLLRVGGTLALSTPNVDSRGHRRFGRYWLHLDVPRHLHLFSASSLGAVLTRAGFREFSLSSAAKSAASTWLSSAGRERSGLLRLVNLIRAVVFHLAESNAVCRGDGGGEELFAWATGPDECGLGTSEPGEPVV